MIDCDYSTLVEDEIDRVLTQYRESPHLLGVIRADLAQIKGVIDALCGLPEHFDIATAIGDQLTIVGKRIGWPRCHCVCASPPIFGFPCEADNPNQPIVGFCDDGVWGACRPSGTSTICLDDDEVYRAYLYVRCYQILALYEREHIEAAVRLLWGEAASVLSGGGARVCLAPGRALTAREEQELPLVFRVAPIPPGMSTYVLRGAAKYFGFGSGYGGFCDEAEWMCPVAVDPYACN